MPLLAIEEATEISALEGVKPPEGWLWITTSPNLANWTMAGTVDSLPLARGLAEVTIPSSVEQRKKTSFPFAADMASMRRDMQLSEISSVSVFTDGTL